MKLMFVSLINPLNVRRKWRTKNMRVIILKVIAIGNEDIIVLNTQSQNQLRVSYLEQTHT